MQERLSDAQVTILLHTLDFQLKEIQRRQEREQQIFQWASSLLLAVFGAAVTLHGSIATLPALDLIKLLASLMVLLPVLFSAGWILRLSGQAVGNAEVVNRIQTLLSLFDKTYYGAQSPYPSAWQDQLPANLRARRTPLFYVLVLVSMTLCVVTTIWILL